MKFKAKAGEFATTSALANCALDPKVKAEVAHAVRVTAFASGVRIVVNALGRAVSTACAATVTEPGEAAVRAAALAGIVANLSRDSTVSVETTGAVVTVEAGSARYQLATIPVEGLPAMLVVGSDAPRIELDPDQAVRILTIPASACDTGPGRFYLGGVYLTSDGAMLTAVGTDGHRLLKLDVPATGTLPGVIVPLASTKIAAKLLAKTKAKISLRSSRTLFELATPNVVFVTKLIDGKYPDYERVIPSPSGNDATVAHGIIAAALERLAAAADPGSEFPPAATIAWSAGELRLGLLNQPDAAADTLAAETTGRGSIVVKLPTLAALVGGIAGPTITLDRSSAATPIRITDPDDPGLLALLAPLVDRPSTARPGAPSRSRNRANKTRRRHNVDMTKFGSPHFVTIADVRPGPFQVAIAGSRQGKFEKPDLLFTNGDALSLNASNRRILVHAYGAESDNWVGKVIELSLGTVEFQGKEQESVVVRPISPPLTPAELAAQAEKAAKTARTENPASDDSGDEIPFDCGGESGSDRKVLSSLHGDRIAAGSPSLGGGNVRLGRPPIPPSLNLNGELTHECRLIYGQVFPERKGADLDDDIESLRAEIDQRIEANVELQAELGELAPPIKSLRDQNPGPADDETTH